MIQFRGSLLGETLGSFWQGHYWRSLITDLIFNADDGKVKAGQCANGQQQRQRPISLELLSAQAAISSSGKAIFYFLNGNQYEVGRMSRVNRCLTGGRSASNWEKGDAIVTLQARNVSQLRASAVIFN